MFINYSSLLQISLCRCTHSAALGSSMISIANRGNASTGGRGKPPLLWTQTKSSLLQFEPR